MSSVDNFISDIKEKRNEAVEYFLSEDYHQAISNGVEAPEVATRKGIDQLVTAVLDIVEERYDDIITAEAEDGDASVTVTCASDLSTLYMEEVSS